MDTSFVNQVVVAVLAILFWNLMPYFSMLFVEACQKLKTLITLTSSPTPSESLETIEDLSESFKGEHDVFLSFRGEDTRNNFVCHLYNELDRRGIPTFIDDKRLKKGKSISPSLIEAIEKSKISIVVLSPNYASSSWCLDELVKIIECMETKQQLVFPVFVNVDPSDLNKQRGSFTKAFIKHRISFVSSDRIRKWRSALSKIATIAGWDSRNCFDGNQAQLIQFVVGEVSKSSICKESSSETSALVGIDSFLMDIDEKLDLKCNDVRMLGIWGIGGIGKTTIAEYIYRRDCRNYKACCLLKGVKDKYKQNGAIALQEELIFQTLSERVSNICNENDGYNVIKRLQRKKVLIILDDIDEQEQLEVLANNVGWFGQGSRIIITTRNKSLLVQHDVKHICKVPFLKRDDALQLFSMCAFKKDRPPMDFLELSDKFVFYTQGLPLALKVLGSSLYKKKMNFWQSQLEKLRTYPHEKIYEILKISYDGLGEHEKKVFLYIALFFDRKAKGDVEGILHQCGFHPLSALQILEERALLTFSFNTYYHDEIIDMHDLIKLMGRKIVREEDPSKQSILCDANEIKDVLTEEKEGRFVEGISLNMAELREPIYLRSNVFKKMKCLKILKVINYINKTEEIHFLEDVDLIPNGLRYFHWDFCPLKSFSSNSFGKNLVELLLRYGNTEILWEGEMEFRNLKKIDISWSRKLKALPDLSKAPNLEEIRLQGCQNLNEFLFDLRDLPNLKILDFNGCEKLDKLPLLPTSLVELFLSFSVITELPPGFQSLTKLKILYSHYCKKLTLTRFTESPQCIGQLKSLEKLFLDGAPIEELPQAIEHLHELKSLSLYGCSKLVRLPSCMHKLASLLVISVYHCTSLVSLPRLPPSLLILSANFCKSLETLECNNWNNFRLVAQLSFVGCNKLDNRSRNEIMECARVMSHSYREYYFRLRNLGFVPEQTEYIVLGKEILYTVPRKEILEWFGYKSCESSITVNLPPSPHQIRGFAFCVIYTDTLHIFTVVSDLIDLKSKVEVSLVMSVRDVDHVAVWYYHFNDREREALTKHLGREIQFNISFHSYRDQEKVKKWGLHMIPDEEGLANLPLLE